MGHELKDKILRCADCSEEFVFTISAQEYFIEKGFMDDPKRCKSCYMELKRTKKSSSYVESRKSYQQSTSNSPKAASGNLRNMK